MRRLASALMIAAIVCATDRVSAQDEQSFDGQWRAGPTRLRVKVSEWGPDCGPRPRDATIPGSGKVNIQHTGNQLTLLGRRRQSTTACWSENPAVKKVGHTHENGKWTVRCKTPKSDSKQESGTYVLQAKGDNVLQYLDVSKYDWQLNESACRATLTSTQTFKRIVETPTEQEVSPPKEPPTEQPQTRPAACTPTGVTKLSITPKKVEAGRGERLQFRVRAWDSQGCGLPSDAAMKDADWSLRGPEGHGCEIQAGLFTCADGAAALGTYQVITRLGKATGRAKIVLKTFDLASLIARRATQGAVGGDQEQYVAITGSTRTRTVHSKGQGLQWLWVAGLGVLLMGGALWLRTRVTKRTIKFKVAAPVSKPSIPVASANNLICPMCRRGYARGILTCPTDGTALVPYREFVEGDRDRMTKRCPVCGTPYPEETVFCGKDGAQLEAIHRQS